MNIMYLSHLLQITFVMWIGYLVAWMPYTILSLIITYSPTAVHLSPKLTAIAALLTKSSTVYNPLIYVFSSVRYRKAVGEELYKVKQSLTGVSNKTKPSAGKTPSTDSAIHSGEG